MKPLTLRDLKALLNQYDENLPVAYSLFSEYVLMEAKDIEVMELQPPREDGWVHRERPDKQTIKYLVFPGN